MEVPSVVDLAISEMLSDEGFAALVAEVFAELEEEESPE